LGGKRLSVIWTVKERKMNANPEKEKGEWTPREESQRPTSTLSRVKDQKRGGKKVLDLVELPLWIFEKE